MHLRSRQSGPLSAFTPGESMHSIASRYTRLRGDNGYVVFEIDHPDELSVLIRSTKEQYYTLKITNVKVSHPNARIY